MVGATDTDSNEVAVVRSMWSAFDREGLEGILDAAAPDATWEPYSAGGRRFESTEEYREYIRGMAERHEVVEARLAEIEQRGEWVVVSGTLRVRRPGALQDSTMHWAHRIVGGQVIYTASYASRERALEAAGITG